MHANKFERSAQMGDQPPTQMKLGVFLITSGHHIAAWRHPDAYSGATIDEYVAIAQMSEAAKLDMVFIADTLSSRTSNLEASSRNAHSFSTSLFEPMTLLAAMSARTEKIGLIGTASTTFMHPYNLARQFASLDHVSKGRAGWNIVTTADDESAQNFGLKKATAHDFRYTAAEECVDVVRMLWDSWEDDAIVHDRENGRFFAPQRMHKANHVGEHYQIAGPLNIPRPPQGHPILVQAGSSGPGRDLAARVADIIFTANPTLEEAISFRDDIKARAAGFGRDPATVLVMPGVTPVVGKDRQDAMSKLEQLHAMIDPEIAINTLQNFMPDVDLQSLDLDQPVPDLPVTEAQQSRQRLALDMARRENLTLRQLAQRFSGQRGHWTPVGSPVEVADQMEEFFLKGGADGFNLMPSMFPTMLEEFVDLVLPELRKRGLFRSEYEGSTLRENLGLPFPEHPARS